VIGSVASYLVSPSLPAGLALNPSTGILSGTPTSSAAQTPYTVTASNTGGETSASIAIVVNSASKVFLDLGHVTSLQSIRVGATTVLSQDQSGHWALWNYASDAELASGDQQWPVPSFTTLYQWPVDLEGSTVAIGLTNGVELRSATDGHLMSTIASPLLDNLDANPGNTLSRSYTEWWKLATDGSYLCAGTKDGLAVWSINGQLLLSEQGDYSVASAFATPTQLQIALGAAGANVIETITISSGTSSVGPAFQGNFNSWFTEGSKFLTTEGNTVWTYSNASVQQAIVSLPTVAELTGQGNWIWTYNSEDPSYPLNIYSIGSSTAAATFTFSASSTAIASGSAIGILPYGTGAATVIDLSGSTPAKTDYTFPIAYPSAFGASSASEWLVGAQFGVILDGASLPHTARYFGDGAAWSIAGSSSRAAVATANRQIFYFDPSTSAVQGTIAFSSSKIEMSSDGSVLAASANANDAQYELDRTLNIYSLPSNSVSNSFPYQFSGSPTLFDFSLSQSGQTLGQVLGTVGSGNYTRNVSGISGSPIIWSGSGVNYSSPIQLSPDGTMVAVSNGAPSPTSTSNILKNGLLVTAVPGYAAGWIDNDSLLVNTYNVDSSFQSAATYSATGTLQAAVSIPEVRIFQPVTSDLIYSPKLNAIFSLSSGSVIWTSPNQATGVGAIAGRYVVYASGTRVLIDTY
jgi:hypothetical protein